MEISDALKCLETKIVSPGMGNELSDICDMHNHILELKDMLQREKKDYHVSKLISIWRQPVIVNVCESASVICVCLF